ncbi:hypothetical protein EGT74_18740 [Chitinophaga lutea]|uniref:Organic solvent tolerance-like N-terminal domain-containing protein n=1 Tax=Chitinophaga lutea TaxID=2488634 RepID=A0A3N4PLF7_9BACT|nr:OstA-like protein [Chitinophaga lutea]RPE09046.1 hypothetical protein EGT74_18740 [Chitinophaga lutea]
MLRVFILLAGLGATGLLAANSRHAVTLPAQTPQQDTSKRIQLVQAKSLINITKDTVAERRFRGDVIFRQGTSLLYCDSAVLNQKKNIIEAWGHVHINQDDSIHTYSDELLYMGDTRIATLTGNAKLTDNKIVLTSPQLNYDMNTKIGTYDKGGKLVNGESVLTSKEGFYYAETKDVYFKKDVVIVDPGFTLSTDTLLYNSTTKIATIMAPTTINDGKATMYVSSGFYNTDNGYGSFGQRPVIEDSTNTFTANEIQTDKATGISVATGNMIWRDTAQKVAVLANYGIVNQNLKTVLATQKPVMMLEGKTDTLFVAADTLFSGIVKKQPDTVAAKPGTAKKPAIAAAGKPSPADTTGQAAFKQLLDYSTDEKDTSNIIAAKTQPDTTGLAAVRSAAAVVPDTAALLKAVKPPDTSLVARTPELKAPPAAPAAERDTTEKRYLIAYHHVKIYSDSLQGVADSVYYSGVDSIFRLFREPVLWANGNQLLGDTIFLFTKNQKADRLLLDQNALIVNEAGPQMYNQIKGNTIFGYFGNEKLDSMYVNGNAENIYYVQDDDSAFISINRLQSAATRVYFQNGELERVVFIKEPEATMYPFTQMPEDQKLLQGFRWEIRRKPKSKYELLGQ